MPDSIAIVSRLVVLPLSTPDSASAVAAVAVLRINGRAPTLDGQAFGEAGAYQKITGSVTIAVDPDRAANARITDPGLAPRDEDGRVRASADFMVFKPLDPGRSNGVGLLAVSDRGGKASLRYSNDAPTAAADPAQPEQGLLLVEDQPRVLKRAAETWAWVHGEGRRTR